MENGTIIFDITPTDEDGVALDFDDLIDPQWQLMRSNGTVVNDRTFANSSMTSLEFVLLEDDLAIFGSSDRGNRVLSFQSSYVSTLSDGTTFTGRCIAEGTFNIQKVLGQVDRT